MNAEGFAIGAVNGFVQVVTLLQGETLSCMDMKGVGRGGQDADVVGMAVEGHVEQKHRDGQKSYSRDPARDECNKTLGAGH
jgi:hypothetical protein